MRTKRLTRWIAGALAGCPGIVDVSPTEGSPSTPAPRVGTRGDEAPPMDGVANQREHPVVDPDDGSERRVEPASHSGARPPVLRSS